MLKEVDNADTGENVSSLVSRLRHEQNRGAGSNPARRHKLKKVIR